MTGMRRSKIPWLAWPDFDLALEGERESGGPSGGDAGPRSWPPVETATEQFLRSKDVRIPRVKRQGRIAVAAPPGENPSLDPDPLHPPLLDPIPRLAHTETGCG